MAIPRLGYACINTIIQEDPTVKKKDRFCVNKSCTAATFRQKGSEYASELAKSNLTVVLKVLEWNEIHGIRLYRLSSDMLPHITNPEFIEPGEDYAYPLSQFQDIFDKIGNFARKYGHRLTFHPGQFNQIGTPNEEVFNKTVRDLKMHCEILDRIGCDKQSVMVVHGGGTYCDKTGTTERWIKQFYKLPENVRNRLVIENCERQYTYKDMLYISNKIKRPVVFDTHHHDCYSKFVEELPNPSEFIDEIVKSWSDLGIIPKFHISEQAPNKKVGAHSDYVENIPDYLFELVKKGINIDIMIEAKAKEQAVLQLYSKYYKFNDNNGNGQWDNK